MAISTYQELSWGNSQTFYLSQIWSLYCRELHWDWQLCDLGYYGYADPRFDSDVPSPDILAFHEQGDVQQIHIETFPGYEFGANNRTDKSRLKDAISEAAKSNAVSSDVVSTYLKKRSHKFSPSTQEAVCVLPYEVYEQYESFIDREINDNNTILWLVKTNGKTQIWKETGSHSNLDLDNEISSRLKAYPSSNDLLQYARSTDDDRLKFEFIQRLARRCGRRNKLSFTFEEADEIMVETHPPILGHLREEVRKEEYWGNYLYYMLNRPSKPLIELGEDEENSYKWTQVRFIQEPRHRHKILSQVRQELGLDKR